MAYPACEYCGKQCRHQKSSTSFGGFGVPSHADLDCLLAPSVQRRRAERGGSGYAHNEGGEKNCYQLLLGVHNQLVAGEQSKRAALRSAGPSQQQWAPPRSRERSKAGEKAAALAEEAAELGPMMRDVLEALPGKLSVPLVDMAAAQRLTRQQQARQAVCVERISGGVEYGARTR